MRGPSEFAEYHRPALEIDEARYNLILANVERLSALPSPDLLYWDLGSPGGCAVQREGYPIVLGEPTREQCLLLAEQTAASNYPGVVGPDATAAWFAHRATQIGLPFREAIPQQIQALRSKPKFPNVNGRPRMVEAADLSLFLEWMTAFSSEAVPDDPAPKREQIERTIADSRFQFWVVNDEPVSMAGIVRRTRNAAAIAGVYTPPAFRGRGYAGSVTASVVESIFREGKSTACRYTDLRNLNSNRCYAKIGFTPVCLSWHYLRHPFHLN
jgi:RimJ/RimL family protein N-acetyltransferase